MSVATRLNARVLGAAGAPAMVFAHGFGCDQSMWHRVVPAFATDHQLVLFDLLGWGRSDVAAYDPERYSRLESHAEDVVDLCHELGLEDVVFVGHSVSAMIGALAHLAAPDLFSALVMVGPSARYLDDDSYVGGFAPRDVDDLLELMDSNHLGWQAPLASMLLPDPEHPELTAELEETFCRAQPDIARQFARVTFQGDNRADLAKVAVPTLVVQSQHDTIAPLSAGRFVHQQIAGSRMVVIDGHGHCPHLSSPTETAAAIREFLTP